MSIHTKISGIILILFFNLGLIINDTYAASGDVSLYTPFTKISVPPGESIDYIIDVKNNSSETRNVNISVSSMPGGWNYTLKSGGWNIKQLSILPGEKKSLSFKVEVPLKVNKGNYVIKIIAEGFDVLPVVVNVSEQGTFKTEFTTDQANMEGHSKSTFTYKAKLKNQTAEKQLYSLRSETPQGWTVIFKPDYKQATSVEIEPNASKDISIEIKAPEFIETGTYKIPVTASTNSTSASLDLEVVITGTYEIELTTPKGLLNTSIKAGADKRIELLIKNTGTAELNNIKLTVSKPMNWDVVFEPETIDKLVVGSSTKVFSTIKADKKAIAGDYAATITASTPEVSSKASFRISVKTPLLWGWIGILIILAALGSVFYLFRKYGRR